MGNLPLSDEFILSPRLFLLSNEPALLPNLPPPLTREMYLQARMEPPAEALHKFYA
jgi:hypothetical protein